MDRATFSLRICGIDLDPAQITAQSGLEPTFSYVRGEPYARNKLRRESGMWNRSVENVSPSEFSIELTKLLSMLPDTFNETLAAAGATADIFVGLFGIRDQSTFDLESEALRLLHNYGLTVIFDMYVAEKR